MNALLAACTVFFVMIVGWIYLAMRGLKREMTGRHALVGAALDELGEGVVLVGADGQLVYCNNYYLDLYGISRSEIFDGMSGRDLLALRRAGGTMPFTNVEFYERSGSALGLVMDLPSGRSVRVRNKRLANGGTVAIHEDCTEQQKLSCELARTKQFLETVIDFVPVCIAAKDITTGEYIFVNREFEKFADVGRDMIVGRKAEHLFGKTIAAQITAADRDAIEVGKITVNINVKRHGDIRVLAQNRVMAHDPDGGPIFLLTIFEDVTDKMSLANELEGTRRFLETIVDHLPVSLMVQDAQTGRYLLANRSSENVTTIRREDIIGRAPSDVFEPARARAIMRRDEEALRGGGVYTEEHPIKTTDDLRLFLVRRATVKDEADVPKYLIKTHEDITARRQTEAQMAHMTSHDGLTDLPNRRAFMQSLSQLVEACVGTVEEFAVLSIDLDGLKEINDVFGSPTGDRVLIEVARRLQLAARGGVVARLGGDEFGLVIDGNQPDAGLAVANRIRAAFSEDVMVNSKSVRVGGTIGMALYPRDGADPTALLANASAAMFRAKTRARGSIGVFEPEMDRALRDRRALHQDLALAIHRGQLMLHFQPQARTGRKVGFDDITGFEALARWNHPERGLVSPGEFIPLAEESGLIVELGEWILREACREAAAWPVPLQIAVNLSPAQFVRGDLVGLVASILEETGLRPGRLELEVTEGVLIGDFDRAVNLLRQFKALGVRVSMDDFGSGYSSLTYLQAFPFDKIKIDRGFIINLGITPQSAAIVRAVIGLGQGLNVAIVAEGVETEEQLLFLEREGCDSVQGFFIGRPEPIEHYSQVIGRTPPPEKARVRESILESC